MPTIHFTSLLIVLAAGLLAPLLLGFFISPARGLLLLGREPQAVLGQELPSPVMPIITTDDRAFFRVKGVASAGR